MTDTVLSQQPWRQRLADWIERPRAQFFIMALIMINAVVLGLETSPQIMQEWGTLLLTLDKLILAIFVIEISLRFVAHGWRLLTDPWGNPLEYSTPGPEGKPYKIISRGADGSSGGEGPDQDINNWQGM